MNGMNGQKKKNGSTAIQNTPRIMIEHCQQDQTGFLEIKKKFSRCDATLFRFSVLLQLP